MRTEKCKCGGMKSKGSIQCMACYGARLSDVNESAFHVVWNDYVQQARRHNREWSLTQTEARDLLSSPCVYCGQPPRVVKTIKYGRGSFVCNGIDRQDNSQGYVLTNCVSCCKVCNIMKQGMSVEDFLAHVRRIAAN